MIAIGNLDLASLQQVADGNRAFLRHAEKSGAWSLHRMNLYSKAL